MRLLDKGGDGTVELLPGMSERLRRVERWGRIARMQAGLQDASVGLGEEKRDAAAFWGDDVAMPSAEPLDRVFPAQAAEIGRLSGMPRLTARGLLRGEAAVRAADVRRATDIREALRRLATRPQPRSRGTSRRRHKLATTDAAGILARLARDVRLVIRVRRDGTMSLEPEASGVVEALGRLLAAALAAQMDGTWRRVKACRRCNWAFYDHSRNRSGA
jgi:predicted RNA-binding Zn ribbon-like protein